MIHFAAAYPALLYFFWRQNRKKFDRHFLETTTPQQPHNGIQKSQAALFQGISAFQDWEQVQAPRSSCQTEESP